MDVKDPLILREVRSNRFPFRNWTSLDWCPEDLIQVKRKPKYLSVPLPLYRGFSCFSVHIQFYLKFDCDVESCTISISRSGWFSLHRSGREDSNTACYCVVRQMSRYARLPNWALKKIAGVLNADHHDPVYKRRWMISIKRNHLADDQRDGCDLRNANFTGLKEAEKFKLWIG
jgi:hypothetical protein